MLAELLAAARHERGHTQREAAARLGVSQPTALRWEQGLTLPDNDEAVAKLARYVQRPRREVAETIRHDELVRHLDTLVVQRERIDGEIADIRAQLGCS